MKSDRDLCPCSSGKPFAACCADVLSGKKPAATAEALMRSRYTAYVMANEAYLLGSWHPVTRPTAIAFDPQQRWLGLKIRGSQESAGKAVVEFVARFKIAGRGYRLHEVSRFERGDQGWLYIDGVRGATDSSQQT